MDPKPLTLSPELEPWELQPEEPETQYAKFKLYRDMGLGRTLIRVADLLAREELIAGKITEDDFERRKNCIRSDISRSSSAGKWPDRAKAYDRHMDAQEVAEAARLRKEAVKSASQRHANLATGLVSLATKAVGKVVEQEVSKNGASRVKLSDLTLGEILLLVNNSVDLEREVLGIGKEAESVKPEPEADPAAVPGAQVQRASDSELIAAARVAAAQAVAAYAEDPPVLPPTDVVESSAEGDDDGEVEPDGIAGPEAAGPEAGGDQGPAS